MTALSLEDWNWAVLMLTQATIGAISPNFRAITLRHEGGRWGVETVLWRDDPTDRFHVENMTNQFSIFLDDVRDRLSPEAYCEIDSRIALSSAPIPVADGPDERPIFRMRA